MEYIGPKGGKGLIVNGAFYAAPWDWSEDDIKQRIEQDPKLDKYFAKKASKTRKNTSNTAELPPITQ